MNLMRQSEYARRVGVKRQALANWKKRGWLVFHGDLVDVDATDANLKRYRSGGLKLADPALSIASAVDTPLSIDSPEAVNRLHGLDWKRPATDWSYAAQVKRAQLACQCIGDMVMVQSAAPVGDGQWGGWQLRCLSAQHRLTSPEQIWTGYGYELLPADILQYCRDWITDNDDVQVGRPDLLHALAYPLWEGQPAPQNMAA